MTTDMRQKFWTLFNDEIQGGVSSDMWSMIDVWIDEGVITQEEWNDNEMSICILFDDHWFTCARCGWTMPVSDMGEDEDGEMVCGDCNAEH